jgi:hypothetical protein
MPVFLNLAPRTQSAPGRALDAPRRRRAALLLAIGALLTLPLPSAGRHLVLSQIHFPDTFGIYPDPPRFDPPPAPWLLALELPPVQSPPDSDPPARQVASQYAGDASAALLARTDETEPNLVAQLESVSAPLGLIRVISVHESPDDGSAAYLMISSMVLFAGSTLLGYLTRQHPAYSLTDKFLAVGGRPPPPLLLLPVVPERG